MDEVMIIGEEKTGRWERKGNTETGKGWRMEKNTHCH